MLTAAGVSAVGNCPGTGHGCAVAGHHLTVNRPTEERIRNFADIGSPSTASPSLVDKKLRDSACLSPCASVFLLKAHLLMFPSLEW